MKLSLIYEATVDQVQRRIPHWIKKYFDGNDIDADWYIPQIIKADPTKGKYSEWLVRQWKNKTVRFPEDTEKLFNLLTLFNQKKSKLDDRDLNNYTPGELAKALDQQFGLTNSERREARKGGMQLPPGARVVVEKGNLTAVKITDASASSLLCSGTEWCVANKDTAQDYLDDGPLYLIYVDGKREYLCHLESEQFMDVYDSEIDVELQFELLKLIEPDTGVNITNNAEWAFKYAKEIVKGRFKKGEPVIASELYWAVKYAREVIKGRWPAIEPNILKSSSYVYPYARDVIKGRWPEGEPSILKSISSTWGYIGSCVKGRWPEAEPLLAEHAFYSYYYALEILKGRFPAGEDIISKNADYAFYYVRDIIKGRWPKGEEAMMRDLRHWGNYQGIVRKSEG